MEWNVKQEKKRSRTYKTREQKNMLDKGGEEKGESVKQKKGKEERRRDDKKNMEWEGEEIGEEEKGRYYETRKREREDKIIEMRREGRRILMIKMGFENRNKGD